MFRKTLFVVNLSAECQMSVRFGMRFNKNHVARYFFVSFSKVQTRKNCLLWGLNPQMLCALSTVLEFFSEIAEA